MKITSAVPVSPMIGSAIAASGSPDGAHDAGAEAKYAISTQGREHTHALSAMNRTAEDLDVGQHQRSSGYSSLLSWSDLLRRP